MAARPTIWRVAHSLTAGSVAIVVMLNAQNLSVQINGGL